MGWKYNSLFPIKPFFLLSIYSSIFYKSEFVQGLDLGFSKGYICRTSLTDYALKALFGIEMADNYLWWGYKILKTNLRLY
jgi:hypothetical protein